ncbi:hypothetical protein JCM19232_5976 [Vibrio ishigakensis]|uniref:Salmonella typhi CT18 n=1 Tax=Vibrio ishigakensis TaxID=1481914 RepID=A0A0B8P4H3_9VIBR|nr:hypothetical protein JCM19232_5976 [Vibrio ishigakensis]
MGASSYRVISILESEHDLERFTQGFNEPIWGTEWNITTSGFENQQVYYVEDSEFPTYVIFESNASAVGSARLLSVSVNEELTETGLGEAKVANHISTSETTNPNWDRPLPFYAQDVIDKGFSLPLPFGVSIIYADTYQRMSITDLEAGMSWRGNGTRPIEFVTFDNNYSHSQSPQLKLDAWVFPFMNVFATVGKVNGIAHVEFDMDGNTLVGNSGADCSGLFTPPVCRLQDKSVTVPLDVDLDGWNYTLGTVLAAGWQDYFLAIPASVSYVDMKNAKAEELVINVSPRIGKQFHLKDSTSLDVYLGASYLDSTLTIKGQHYFKTDALEGEHINYKIKQENLDKWMGLIGASYNFNRSWALQAEYGQSGSDKRQFVSSLTHRF